MLEEKVWTMSLELLVFPSALIRMGVLPLLFCRGFPGIRWGFLGVLLVGGVRLLGLCWGIFQVGVFRFVERFLSQLEVFMSSPE